MALSYGRVCKKYVFGNSDKISGASNMGKFKENKPNTSTQLIQQYNLYLWLIYYLLHCSYLPFKWLKHCLRLYRHGQKVEFLICGPHFPTGILLYV